TTTVSLNADFRCSARSRAERSALPPAGNGTTRRIGRLGQLWAKAGRARTAAAAANRAMSSRRRMGIGKTGCGWEDSPEHEKHHPPRRDCTGLLMARLRHPAIAIE